MMACKKTFFRFHFVQFDISAGGIGRVFGPLVIGWILIGMASFAWCEKFSTVSPTAIRAGFFYSGADIRVHGLIHRDSDVAIRAIGPVVPEVFNRKERIWLIWGGVGHVNFQNAPSSYFLLTSGTLPAMAEPLTRECFQLGYPMLIKQIRPNPSYSNTGELLRDFIRLKEREGLYSVHEGGVHISDVQLGRFREFEGHLYLPPIMPPGRIELEVLELRDGIVINRDIHEIYMEREGIPAVLGSLARKRPALFGFITLAAMVITGLLFGLITQPRRKGEALNIDVLVKATLLRILDSLRVHIGQPGEQKIQRMKEKYREFQTLLSLNNEVLELLADLEEEASWASFRHARVRMAIRALLDGSMDMVRTLNRLADSRYFDLETVVTSIRKEVTSFLENLPEVVQTRPTIALEEVKSSNAGQVGGKASNLARVQSDLSMPIPDSFVVTTEAYRQFLEKDGLTDRIRAILAPVRTDHLEDLDSRSRQAMTLIEEAPIQPSLAVAFEEAVKSLNLAPGQGLAVRSSGVGEDSSLSFAGQFESILNVRPERLAAAWKSVIASRYLARAIFYRRTAGVAEVDTPMAVLVQRMITPRASGVLYTRRPDRPQDPVLLISSAWGLGRDVSSGSAEVDEWVLSRRNPREVLERHVRQKRTRLDTSATGGVASYNLSTEEQFQPSLTDDELFFLAEKGLKIDRYFGEPQDVEWAVDTDGKVIILQARPLRTEKAKPAGEPPPDDATILAEGGSPVWAGRAVGSTWCVESTDALDRVPEGSILVLPQPLADGVRVLPRVCGVIVEHGSVTGHMASVLREFRVPSLFGLEGAMSRLKSGMAVSMDSSERKVYDGILWPKLRGRIALSLSGRRATGLPETLAERLTTLSGGFFMATWTCRSIHDVVRFAHEMAIQSMFEIGGELSHAKLGGVRILKDSPLFPIHLIDLGGGLSPGVGVKRNVTQQQIVCVPFRALLQGLMDERFQVERFEEESGSFASVMMTTAFGGSEGRALGTPSYACLTSSYMNLNSRQAYHFAIVDAHVCDNQNSNHLSFRLKGGGAAEWQRLLRVRFLAEVLRMHHFTVSERGDLLNAWLRGLDIPTSKRKMAMIGRLLRFCGQLDMWMTRPEIVQKYVNIFLKAEEKAQ